MDREFSPQRVNETEDQYDNRYNAHLRRIQNTQQSWNRPGYDIPPHIPQDQRDIPVTDPPETRTKSTRIRPPPPRVHPRAAVNAHHRGEMLRAIHEMNMNVSDARVQFESASRPYPTDQNSEAPPEEYHTLGPGGISAYRVTRGPPNNGLWNAEQYHYTVLIKCIRQLVHWKVGNYISAPARSKQPKMGEPTKYSGNRSHDMFLQWLNQFLNWLRSHYHCRDEADFVVNIPIYSPFPLLLSIVSITFLIYFRSIYLKHTI